MGRREPNKAAALRRPEPGLDEIFGGRGTDLAERA